MTRPALRIGIALSLAAYYSIYDCGFLVPLFIDFVRDSHGGKWELFCAGGNLDAVKMSNPWLWIRIFANFFGINNFA